MSGQSTQKMFDVVSLFVVEAHVFKNGKLLVIRPTRNLSFRFRQGEFTHEAIPGFQFSTSGLASRY
ncbi:hypothetical protein LP7551_04162 [Roseibium album]|nr:hypothetical protein LP7551_04162 [Roseibium album]